MGGALRHRLPRPPAPRRVMVQALAPLVVRSLLIAWLTLAAMTASAWAQAKPAPSLSLQRLTPTGCQRGVAQEIELAGAGLKDVTSLFLLDPAIGVTRGEKDRWRIEAGEAAVPRDRDLWAVGTSGVAGPLRFSVSLIPQALEEEKNDAPDAAQRVECPVVVHGRIEPGVDRDWLRFAAERGEHVAIACRSYSLDGLVEPALTVVDPLGREIRHDPGGARDGFVHFTAEESGEHLVLVQERAYRQNKANGYALEIRKGPWLLAAFPHVLKAGSPSDVTLYGYALPGGSKAELDGGAEDGLKQLVVSVTAPAEGDVDGGGWTPASAVMFGGFAYQHPGVGGSIRFQLADAEIVAETDAPNDRIGQAQALSLPVEVAGRFLTRNDVDWYRFQATKGQTLWIEAVGQRAGETIDLDAAIHDEKGKLLLALGDQAQPKGFPAALPLDTLDPGGAWKVPADGEYCLAIRDLYGSIASGVNRGYRLSIGPRREAATIVAVTAGVSVKPGGSASLKLIVVRRGGHKAPIRIWAENLPPGLGVQELTLPGDKAEGELQLTAAADAASFTGALQLAAETQLDGQTARIPVRIIAHIHDGKPQRVRLCEGLIISIPAAK